MNKVILLGYVGRDPEIRYVETRPVASFTLATTDRAKRLPNGTEIPERTEWHNIVMWDANAEIAERYIRKGTRLILGRSIGNKTDHYRDSRRKLRPAEIVPVPSNKTETALNFQSGLCFVSQSVCYFLTRITPASPKAAASSISFINDGQYSNGTSAYLYFTTVLS